MPAKNWFTPEEDIQMWRFALKNHDEHGYNMWKAFIKKTGSKRDKKALHSRFRNQLAPSLSHTKFHPETKLRLCLHHKVRVDEEFLKTLQKDAIITLDDHGHVTNYSMNPIVAPNMDKQLDDETFRKLLSNKAEIPQNKSARTVFTPQEDMHMWRFALEDHRNHGGGMWNVFKEKTHAKRKSSVYRNRFRFTLCPHLPLTLFHTETKLKFCIQYKIPIDSEFLKELENDAKVTLEAGLVTGYTMNSNAAPNIDRQLNDDEFLALTSPILKKHAKFTEDEDAEIWKFLRANRRQYSRGSEAFWKNLARKYNGERSNKALAQRFNTQLAPQLHNTKFDMKTKLKLFKSCKIPVDRKFLKILENHYNLEIDENGCINRYTKIEIDEPSTTMNSEIFEVVDDDFLEQFVIEEGDPLEEPLDLEMEDSEGLDDNGEENSEMTALILENEIKEELEDELELDDQYFFA